MGRGLGFDLGTSAVKAVRLALSGGSVRVKAALCVDRPAAGDADKSAPPPLPPDLARELKRAGAAGAGVLGVSGSDVLLKYVSVPPVPPWKLRMLMDYEIRENAGPGMTDVCGDYRKLRLPGDLAREEFALTAVARQDALASAFGAARGVGVRARCAVPGAVALFNAFRRSSSFMPGETTLLLEIGAHACEIAIQRDGDLYFARSAPGGGAQFTAAIDRIFKIGPERAESYKCKRARLLPPDEREGAEPQQKLLDEALRKIAENLFKNARGSIMFCRMQAKLPELGIDRVVLSGGGARLAGLREFLEERLEAPVGYLAFDTLDTDALDAEATALFREQPTAQAVPLGLALAEADPEAFRLELVPESIAKRRAFWGRTVYALLAGACAAGLCAAWTLSAARERRDARERHDALKAKRAAYGAQTREYEKRKEALDALRGHVNLYRTPGRANIALLEFVRLLREKTPDGVTVTGLALPLAAGAAAEANVRVTLGGVANAAKVPDVFATLKRFAAEIERSPRVIEATPTSPSGTSWTCVVTLRSGVIAAASEPEPPAPKPGSAAAAGTAAPAAGLPPAETAPKREGE